MEYEVLELPPRKERIERTRTTRLVHWGCPHVWVVWRGVAVEAGKGEGETWGRVRERRGGGGKNEGRERRGGAP